MIVGRDGGYWIGQQRLAWLSQHKIKEKKK